MGVERSGGDAQGLECRARRWPHVAIEVVGFEVVAIRRALMQAHRHAIDVADLLHDGLANV